ncbi:Tudor/PWWP/MBT domain-containing protein [Dioscorea alata]|uniref:Tudor/PWWP/MBT domain-containing protein n=2 Tax=Dioscorea alata TaxID=55571 RepID=A0ACB7VDM0_DIOAL|nr:Tudor/PWWP/MBT domain-containing protein [Dioscorea alata]KAH7671860.1 Tudor/PWWP/MBT domain-containing protein [Dioscorea alata]
MAGSGGQEELEPELIRVGQSLASLPSDIDDIVDLLDEADKLLARVDQLPSDSMALALYPVMKALIGKEFLGHMETDVRMRVGSCLSEITRITAPTNPYKDDLMKEIFRIVVDGIGGLDDTSSQLYSKRVYMLLVLAKYKSCLMMLDLECHELILEMFCHFLKTISSNPAKNIFSAMEAVMTLIIEDSEIISPGLLDHLLACVKKDHKGLSSEACKLGKRIIANCAKQLKPHLMQKVQSMGLRLSDYCKILADICQDKFVNLKQSQLTDSNESLVDVTRLSESTNSFSERTHSDELPQGFEGLSEEACSADHISSRSEIRGTHDILDSTGVGSQKEKRRKVVSSDDLNDEIHPKRTRLRGIKFARKPGDEILTAERHAPSFAVKGSLVSNQNGEEVKPLVGSSSKRLVKGTEDSEGKLHRHHGRQTSEAPQNTMEMNENLVGSKIKVWWPDDNRFYEGMVESFDPVSRKHKIVYYDDDVEILLLKNERWEFAEGIRKKNVGDKNMPSVDASLDRPVKKKKKRSSNSAQILENSEARPRSGGASASKSEPNKSEIIGTSHLVDGKKHKRRRMRGAAIISSSSDDEPNETPSNTGTLHIRKHKQIASNISREHAGSGTSANIGSKLIRIHKKSKGELPKTGNTVKDHTLRISSNPKTELPEIRKKPKNDAPKKSMDSRHNTVDTGNKAKKESANVETSKADKESKGSTLIEIN